MHGIMNGHRIIYYSVPIHYLLESTVSKPRPNNWVENVSVAGRNCMGSNQLEQAVRVARKVSLVVQDGVACKDRVDLDKMVLDWAEQDRVVVGKVDLDKVDLDKVVVGKVDLGRADLDRVAVEHSFWLEIDRVDHLEPLYLLLHRWQK